MSELKISLIQSNLIWENIDANLFMFKKKIKDIKEDTDLIILPEMFNTGFSMKAEEFHETMEGKTVSWLKEMAKQINAVITGSIIIKEKNKFYNRMIWMRPDGSFGKYDKRHLFRLANEHKKYTPGRERKVVSLKDWKINLNICYDLRFPVWARNDSDYDMIIYIANWPVMRNHHWKTLLKARAIENLSYVIGVNRVGDDGNKVYHSGDSAAIHPGGDILKEVSHDEATFSVSLSKKDLEDHRNKLPYHLDRDKFKII